MNFKNVDIAVSGLFLHRFINTETGRNLNGIALIPVGRKQLAKSEVDFLNKAEYCVFATTSFFALNYSIVKLWQALEMHIFGAVLVSRADDYIFIIFVLAQLLTYTVGYWRGKEGGGNHATRYSNRAQCESKDLEE